MGEAQRTDNEASAYERTFYHFLVEQTGKVVRGNHSPEANRRPLGPVYAEHCGGMNSDNIGIALCGMAGAQERPFAPGFSPITIASYNKAVILAADLCETYGIAVTRRTVFLHSEVRPRFGRGVYKWDVNWLPGMTAPGDPVMMGDAFRARVASELETRGRPDFWVRFKQRFGVAA